MRYTEGGNRKMKMKKKIGKTPPVGKEYIKIFSIRKTVSPPLKEKKSNHSRLIPSSGSCYVPNKRAN